MKTICTLKMILLVFVILPFVAKEVNAQVEIQKDGWSAAAFRYLKDQPLGNAFDGDLTTKFAMGGGLTEGRYFMLDLGQSYNVVKVVVTYVPGEVFKVNYAKGFDLYVTDYEYPVIPSQGPKGEFSDGQPFTPYPDSVTASIPYPEAKEVAELEFSPKKGRFIWFVSNGASSEWWEVHEISVYQKEEVPEEETPEVETPEETSSILFKQENTGFKLYPNPVSQNNNGKLNIELDRQGDLFITDISGRMVYKNTNLRKGINTLDVNLNSGIYFVNVSGKHAEKLIVK